MPISRQNRLGRLRQRGFTLVELMITVAVVGILAVVAVPSMSGMLNSSRLRGATGELIATLQVARSEAIRRNARVTVCSTDDGSTCSNSATWTRWIVRGRDNATGADEIIRDQLPGNSVQISGPADGIVFRPSGVIDSEATVTACVPVSNPANNERVITVMISGSVHQSQDSGGGSCP